MDEEPCQSGTPEHIFEEGVEDEWQAAIRAWKWGSGVEPLKIFIAASLDRKKAPFKYQATFYVK